MQVLVLITAIIMTMITIIIIMIKINTGLASSKKHLSLMSRWSCSVLTENLPRDVVLIATPVVVADCHH